MGKNVLVDQRLDSYKSFFDHAWAEHVMQLSSGKAVSQPVFDLCAMWRAVANTHVMPWLMMQQFEAFAKGMVESHDPFGRKWVTAMRANLVAEMGDKLNNMGRKKLQAALDKVDTRIRTALDEHTLDFDLDKMWSEQLKNYEMQFVLWGSQRLCYGAVYYAYEDFLTRCVALAKSEPDYRMPRRNEFTRDVGDAFGEQVRNRVWCDPVVNAARLVRHALVHNGGRITDELLTATHGLEVVEGELQIMAPDTSTLSTELKDRVTYLVDAIVRGGS
jgi:hypothetical protein